MDIMKSQRIILKFSGKNKMFFYIVENLFALFAHTSIQYLEEIHEKLSENWFRTWFFPCSRIYVFISLACLPSSLLTSIDSGVHLKNTNFFLFTFSNKIYVFLNRFTWKWEITVQKYKINLENTDRKYKSF